MESITTLLINVFLPATAYAADVFSPITDPAGRVSQVGFADGQPGSTAQTVIGGILSNLATFIFTLLTFAAIFVLLYASVQYITAAGNAEKTKAARQTILNTVFGIVLLVCSYAVISVLVSIARLMATL